VDRAGFEPATSTLQGCRNAPNRQEDGEKRLILEERDLKEFKEFLELNMRLSPSTVYETVRIARRFLRRSNWVVSAETVKEYLREYLNRAPWTYNSQIVALRRFIKEYLKRPELITPYRRAPTNDVGIQVKLPTIAQIRAGFEAQRCDRDRALYLFTATTGLRRGEILHLTKDAIDWENRCVKPNHHTRTKRSGITFFNEETEIWLRRYLSKRRDDDPRLFIISDRQFRKIWQRASEAAGIKITPQILRIWFSEEMGERGIPDRYVDIFQGRAPKSILAKYYTTRGIKGLKRKYEKVKLRILEC